MARQLKKHANEEQKKEIDVKREKKKEAFEFQTGFEKYDIGFTQEQPASFKKQAPPSKEEDDFWTSANQSEPRPAETNTDDFAFKFDSQPQNAPQDPPQNPANFDDIFNVAPAALPTIADPAPPSLAAPASNPADLFGNNSSAPQPEPVQDKPKFQPNPMAGMQGGQPMQNQMNAYMQQQVMQQQLMQQQMMQQ